MDVMQESTLEEQAPLPVHSAFSVLLDHIQKQLHLPAQPAPPPTTVQPAPPPKPHALPAVTAPRPQP